MYKSSNKAGRGQNNVKNVYKKQVKLRLTIEPRIYISQLLLCLFQPENVKAKNNMFNIE